MCAQLIFHGQPMSLDASAGAVLRAALKVEDPIEACVAVAWARFGGVVRLAPELRDFRDRGGELHLIVGVDEGVATVPGLALALSLFDHVHLLHDRGGRTFHPKLYLVTGHGSARLLVGSSNLTSAGMYFNFEASLEAHFAFPADTDHAVLTDVNKYLDHLRQDEACLELTDSNFDEMVSDPRLRIAGTERRRKSGPGDIDLDEIEAHEALAGGADRFGKSTTAVTFPPALSLADRELLAQLERDGDSLPDAVLAGSATLLPITTKRVETWSKKLSATDAQHPPKDGSNPTGVLRLSQARHAIDHRTWFRDELFGELNWVSGSDSRNNPTETLTVPFSVEISGSEMGTIDLRVDHAVHREEAQNNVTTILHWGSTLGPVLRSTDLTGSTVILDRNGDGTFRLRIE